jgi:hypothetical protein
VAFKPTARRRRPQGEQDLDITPIMNLVVVLIPMLLASAQFVKYGLLEARLQTDGAGSSSAIPAQEEQPKEKLNLRVFVDSLGFAISVFGALPTGENAEHYQRLEKTEGGEFDFSALNDHLWQIKNDIVDPAKLGQVPNKDDLGNTIFNPDGTVQLVDDYLFSDAENVQILAPNDFAFQNLVKVMDNSRIYLDPETKSAKPMFPTPIMGKLQ